MIKVTVQDAGLFYVLTGSEEGTIQIYDQTKKKKLGTLEAQENTEYLRKAEKGDVFYIKLPKKIGSQDIVTAVLKDGFDKLKAGKNKPIKTINVKTNDYGIVSLPKGKGTYYVKINKLTKKTNGYYVIMDFNQFVEE